MNIIKSSCGRFANLKQVSTLPSCISLLVISIELTISCCLVAVLKLINCMAIRFRPVDSWIDHQRLEQTLLGSSSAAVLVYVSSLA